MKNYIQEGDVIEATMPYARNSGDGVLIPSGSTSINVFGVCVTDIANAVVGEVMIEGVFDITALSTDVIAVADAVYWDDTNKRCTKTRSGNTLIGFCTKAKANADTTVRVRLNSITGKKAT